MCVLGEPGFYTRFHSKGNGRISEGSMSNEMGVDPIAIFIIAEILISRGITKVCVHTEVQIC